jgi:NADPH:quinone reductase-like Zn-dependent oxidoreductase
VSGGCPASAVNLRAKAARDGPAWAPSCEQLRRAEHFINAGLRSGSLSPVIDRTFDLDDVVQAHRYLESNAQIGKIVLTVQH